MKALSEAWAEKGGRRRDPPEGSRDFKKKEKRGKRNARL